MIQDIMQMIGTSFVLVMGTTIVLWLVYIIQKKALIGDLIWPIGQILSAATYTLMGEGFWLRRLILMIMVAGWGLRLAWHLFDRYWYSSQDDKRYDDLKQKWGSENVDLKFLAFFLFHALIVILLSSPFLVSSINPIPFISAWEVFGIVLWVIALAGETAADYQLQKFTRNPANQGKICDIGLWRYSRHPNYFFEALVWIAFFIFAMGSPFGFLTIYCPLVVLFLILKVSGIPPTEAESLRSKGDAYIDYKRRTSAFIPMPPKKG
jgi:steroid 5-alpha reductase family enzyme